MVPHEERPTAPAQSPPGGGEFSAVTSDSLKRNHSLQSSNPTLTQGLSQIEKSDRGTRPTNSSLPVHRHSKAPRLGVFDTCYSLSSTDWIRLFRQTTGDTSNTQEGDP